MRKHQIIISLILIFLLVWNRFYINFEFENLNDRKTQSAISEFPFYNPALVLDGNDAIATFPNITGHGTFDHPFVLTNWSLNSSEYDAGLCILNTTAYLILEYIFISHVGIWDVDNSRGYALYCQNVTNLRITNSSFAWNYCALFFSTCVNLTIDNNHFYQNDKCIQNQNCASIQIAYNQFRIYYGCCIDINFSTDINISQNELFQIESSEFSSGTEGIILLHSQLIEIRKNFFKLIEFGIRGEYLNAILIENNTIDQFSSYAIGVGDSSEISIIENSISNGHLAIGIVSNGTIIKNNLARYVSHGLRLQNSVGNVILMNTFEGIAKIIPPTPNDTNFIEPGIIFQNVNYTLFDNNSVGNFSAKGMQLEESSYNIISNNLFHDNAREGLVIREYQSYNNTCVNNTFIGNEWVPAPITAISDSISTIPIWFIGVVIITIGLKLLYCSRKTYKN